MTWWKETRSIVVETIDEWLVDGVPGRGAALSYYVLLSLGPLLVLLPGVFELFVSEATIRRQAVALARDYAGSGAARTLEGVLARVDPPELFTPASIVGLVALIDAGISLLLTSLLFAALFRTLPETRIEWRTVWVGAIATAILFTLGKFLVARPIAGASWTSYYGPGASLVTFIAWIYFSAQIFYLGAEFTRVWSRRHGGVLAPAGSATPDFFAKGSDPI